jgi:putative addiction module antidote
MRLEIRKIGNSYGVILPKQLIEDLNVNQGDSVYAIKSEEGITLTAYNPDFEQSLAAYEKFSKRYRNTLKKLAK